MKRKYRQYIAIAFGLLMVYPALVGAEILAMLNYESKPNVTPRREGIAIIDVDPASPHYKKIVTDIPVPPDVVAHHIFYDKTGAKAYVTALGSNPLQAIDMKQKPYRLKTVPVPDCQVGEDMVFTQDNKTWFLTCMGSSNVIVGEVATDRVVKTIQATIADPGTPFIRYPHGIGLADAIDRIIVTSTVRPADKGDPGETVTVIEASSGKVLSTHKLSNQASPSGVAPVEAVFVPGANPATAYISVMFGGTIWSAIWKQDAQRFDFQQVYDFKSDKQGVALEIVFNRAHDRMYVTTADPGYLNVFDISNPSQVKLLKAIPTAGGAHHIVFSPDERYAFVQNSFLNLPKMDDGSISVIDLAKMEKVDSIDTLKAQGLNPNCIVLLPEWHNDTSH
jgi:DNA-binding beta-propeller fold protein YncE